MKNIDEFIRYIRKGDNFLLSTHINPDGDGIGAMLGMGWILKKLKKKHALVIDGTVPDTFNFLYEVNNIFSYSEKIKPDFNPQILICVDIPNMARLERVNRLISKETKILNIDHHCSNTNFGHINLLDYQASSCSEIIFLIADAMGLTIDRNFAESIYTGIIIDTGRFRFSNTTAKTFRISAGLADAGLRIDFITELLFHTHTIETIKGLSEVLKTIKIHLNGKFAVSVLHHDFLEEIDVNKMETEGFTNYPLSVYGVEVAALLREVDKNKVRGSLRSKVDRIDVNTLANVFGGGGHKRAAGFVDNGTIEEVTQKLIQKLKKII